MLETLFGKSAHEITSVDDDEQVRIANEAELAAVSKLEQLEREEQALLRIKAGKDGASDAEVDTAHQRLDVLKGTTDRWHLPEAAEARREVERLRRVYAQVREAAKARLTEEALIQLRPLVEKVMERARDGMTAAKELQAAWHAHGQAGCDLPPFPFPAFLDGQIIQFQTSLAGQVFGADRSD